MYPGLNINVRGSSPDALDVAHLWRILTTDLVMDLRFSVEPIESEDGEGIVRLSVHSQRFNDQNPQGYDYVWATREFGKGGYLISWGQLLDLLIVAHRAIIAEFARYNRR